MTALHRVAEATTPRRPSRAAGSAASVAPQRRPTWMLLGALLVLGAGLGAALWSSTLTERTGVLVTARTIQAGQRITSNDLREVQVNTDVAFGTMASSSLHDVVGKVAQLTIPDGTPLQPTMLGAQSPVPAGKLVVGSTLAAGEYPTSGLRPGDAVTLVETTNGATANATSRTLGSATIWSVQRVNAGGTERLFVSLVVDDEQGVTVANAAAGNRLRLLLGAGQ